MSLLIVNVKCLTNNKTIQLTSGRNILGRNNEALGLQNEPKLSRKQLDVHVDAQTKKVTVERVGLRTNVSQLNGRVIPKNQPVEVANGDCVTLVINAYPCVFSIVEAPFSSDPLTSQADPLTLRIPPPVAKRRPLVEIRESDVDADSDDALDGVGRLWPEDFSDESDDVFGSGVEELSEEEPEEQPQVTKRPKLKPVSEGTSKSNRQSRAKRDPAVTTTTQGGSKRKDGRKRQGGRRVTAYGLFSKEVRAQLKKDYPGQPVTAITKLAKRRWFELPDEEREIFEARARQHNAIVEEGADIKEEDRQSDDNSPNEDSAQMRTYSESRSSAAGSDVQQEEALSILAEEEEQNQTHIPRDIGFDLSLPVPSQRNTTSGTSSGITTPVTASRPLTNALLMCESDEDE
ncbi:uncharacterized protein SPPG_00322 [Spizellomyces punctatus DAOM BR117]|uniref:HMG box domain-containing protein n=1 Tax=Spizellomyces punctatus (strain DAOM BR117) TaxID=645134 RepID=A0A0L0HUR8_SPIPD|nr:uncharacterized protein SPPG_00322 [Spizellomyces punctatus DAOM BR117]KND04604.1 hypothetical protein SPPG_00322 [Spizellomyces punctatus DAOM BR117]|eukprot:XP_016612643.1 hypothetical protein SPPG_00322 [Spizellomyces punctatus DAOM BR117]